jgi:hypothetical protein
MGDRDKTERSKVQHELYFTDASRPENFPFISIKDVKNEALHPAWYAFQDSIESVRIMSLLPQAVVSAAVNYLLILTQATFNLLNKPVLEDSDLSGLTVDLNAEYARIAGSFFDRRHKIRDEMGKGLVLYNKYNLVNSPLTRGGFYAILEAQITGVWTAFQVLTTDVCIAAVNAQPKIMLGLGDREIKLKTLLKDGSPHDWTGRMGELLRIFVRFDSFQNTVDAYEQLFRGVPAISSAINSPAARTACLVRTQLAHDGGIVTDNFVKQAEDKQMDPWRKATVGERLPLDGRNVSALSEGVIHCANDLIRAVDEWMSLPAKRAAKPRGQGQ